MDDSAASVSDYLLKLTLPLIKNDNRKEEAFEAYGENVDVVYIDGLLSTGKEDEVDDEQEEEEEDEDDDESFNVEDIPTNDVLTDDNDELQYEHDPCDTIVMKPKGFTLNVREATLGEDSKELLIWRGAREKSFSDWTIKVVAETEDGGDENATAYSVHRSILAMGPKKSGYFEALFKESSECVNTVKLSGEVAAHFPHFLDYMYSQPVESKAIINFAKWNSMAYFSNHFLVPRLTVDVMRFIETDMYNLDHMEHYLSEFDVIPIHDDLLPKCILQKATRVCAEMIRSIKVDSSLLKVISQATFLGMD